MKGIRRAYYDKLSRYYDLFVALHSRDAQGLARKFLADRVPVQSGGSVLDICTGTATLLSDLQAKVGGSGHVVGVDFSRGMLKVAQVKTRRFLNVHLVEADAGRLPFAAGSFDAVTCSHAFYEIKGETQSWALEEILRVLRPKGAFLMMEHDVPSNLFLRVLFYLRLTVAGAGRAVAFLRREREVLEGYFGSVEKALSPAGRSKILICRK
jgi:demethylmenaquinone methyltransferase/2-methoxy-6-polyprenyl-1,4-benzoquinol methylase